MYWGVSYIQFTSQLCSGFNRRTVQPPANFSLFKHWCLVLGVKPFACPQNPAGNDPQRQHEDDEHGARTDGHERLEHKPSV